MATLYVNLFFLLLTNSSASFWKCRIQLSAGWALLQAGPLCPIENRKLQPLLHVFLEWNWRVLQGDPVAIYIPFLRPVLVANYCRSFHLLHLTPIHWRAFLRCFRRVLLWFFPLQPFLIVNMKKLIEVTMTGKQWRYLESKTQKVAGWCFLNAGEFVVYFLTMQLKWKMLSFT